MPIQKRQCPPENVIYDVEGRGARHTLFSSTEVLQAGNNDLDEVLAVVSATGMTLAAANLQVAGIAFSMTACAWSLWTMVVCSTLLCSQHCVTCWHPVFNVLHANQT